MPLILFPLGFFFAQTWLAWAVWETCFPGVTETFAEAWEK